MAGSPRMAAFHRQCVYAVVTRTRLVASMPACCLPHVSARPRGLGLPVRVQNLLLPVMARLSERAVVRREIGPRQAARPVGAGLGVAGQRVAVTTVPPVPASPRGRMPTDRHS